MKRAGAIGRAPQPAMSSFEELRRVVEQIAAPGARTLAEMPAGARGVEALVERFDEAYTSYITALAELPPKETLAALQALDEQLHGMVALRQPELWTREAFVDSQEWKSARRIAGVTAALLSR